MNFSYSSYMLIYNKYIYNFKFLIYTRLNRINYWLTDWTNNPLSHLVNDQTEIDNFSY